MPQVTYTHIPFESSDWTYTDAALWMYPVVVRATLSDSWGNVIHACEYVARSRRVARARCREYMRTVRT